MSTEERTEPATPKKILDALKKGNRPRSALVSHCVVTIGVAIVLAAVGPYALSSSINATTSMFSTMNGDSALAIAWASRIVVTPLALLLVAIFGASLLSVCANIVLGHGQFAPAVEAISPKVSNLSPSSAFKKMFSKRSAYELSRNLLFLLTCAVTSVAVVAANRRDLFAAYTANSAYISEVLLRIILTGLVALFLVSLVFAFADKAVNKLLWLGDLKMPKSEIKREYVQNEGNPQFKQQRRETARQAVEGRDRFDVSNINFALVSAAEKKLLGFCYAPTQLERPITLMKIAGADFDKALHLLKASGVVVVDSSEAVEALYARAPLMDFVAKKSAPYLESIIAKAQ